MPAAIDPIIKQRVIAQYLQGVSRDRIADRQWHWGWYGK